MISVGSSEAWVSGAADEEVGRVAGTPYVVGSGPVTCGEGFERREVGGKGHAEVESGNEVHQWV